MVKDFEIENENEIESGRVNMEFSFSPNSL